MTRTLLLPEHLEKLLVLKRPFIQNDPNPMIYIKLYSVTGTDILYIYGYDQQDLLSAYSVSQKINGTELKYFVCPSLEHVSNEKIKQYYPNEETGKMEMRIFYYMCLDYDFEPKLLRDALTEDGITYL